jgi:hypothetical protein
VQSKVVAGFVIMLSVSTNMALQHTVFAGKKSHDD